MVLASLLLVAYAIAICVIAIRFSLKTFGLSAMQALVWLGLAEVAAPAAPRRRRG